MKNKKKTLEFGNIKSEEYYFHLIKNYFQSMEKKDIPHVISDRTCNDLDFEEFFMFADRCLSRPGQQYLYANLRSLPDHQSITSSEEILIENFTNNNSLRSKTENVLQNLSKFPAYYLIDLFSSAYIPRPKWFWIIPLLSFSSILSLIGIFFNPVFILIFLLIAIVNLLIHYWNKSNLQMYADAMPQLLNLISTSQKLNKLFPTAETEEETEESLKKLRSVKRRLGLFKLGPQTETELMAIAWWLVEVVKIVFIIEPILLFDLLKKLENKKTYIARLFRFVGRVDMLYSIASLRHGLQVWCRPDLDSSNKGLTTKGMYHPLIIDCVPNDFKAEKSILITGSNMSGKTTFIRSLGLNLISAQTINTCFASSFMSKPLNLYTAIRISDDLLSNKSYYLEEILTIREMIFASQKSANSLFLLDELFKGTNTVERVSAGKAVLSYLSANNQVFVSSHDIELVDLLDGQFEMYHFSEILTNNEIDFDYKIKAGHIQKRNAIKILELHNYPQEIVNEAIEISKRLKS